MILQRIRWESQNIIKRKLEIMNILYIAHESRMGGANKSLLGMLDEIRKHHKVYVVVPIKCGFLIDELNKREIPYIYLHSFWWMQAEEKSRAGSVIKKYMYKVLLWYNYFCAWKLKGIVKNWEIDVIHTNSSVINTGGILASMTGLPHVWHIREFCQEGLNFFFVKKPDHIYRFMDRNSRCVIAISESVAKQYSEYISNDKIRIIYNGVGEENLYDKSGTKPPETDIRFLISGRISREKGQEEAVKAVAELRKRGYNNFRLFIAGPGDTTALKKQIDILGISNHVTFLGMREDISEIRKNMEVELVCSDCEAFGRVTVEAMMSSNPVIGTNAGGTTELIEDGVTGFLYTRGNAEQLAEDMEVFLKNPDTVREMGTKAYQSVLGKFTQKENAYNVEKVYEGICRNGQSQP